MAQQTIIAHAGYINSYLLSMTANKIYTEASYNAN